MLKSKKSTAGRSFRNAAMKTLGLEKSEFDEWPMEELAMRLRDDGVDIPPDVNPHDLVAFADEFYAGKPQPPRYSIADVEFTDANGIQYVHRPRHHNDSHHHNHHHHQHQHHSDVTRLQLRQETPNIEADLEAEPLGNHRVVPLDDHSYHEPPMFPSEMTEAELAHLQEQGLLDDLGAVAVDEEEEVMGHTNEAPETTEIREHFLFIEQEEATEARIKNEFQRPSIQVAEKFAALNHPRKSNGKRYSVFCSNTGRFCFSKGRGCFRLIDPFGEGSTSELTKYGVGISLYFKTLKWLFWTFFLMTLAVLPQMVVNSVSSSSSQSIFAIDQTTLGHLSEESFFVNSSANVSDSFIFRQFNNDPVSIPFTNCGGTLCLVDRQSLALYYTISDLVAIGIFLISLRWLHYFARIEGSRITKHHITVEEYTIHVVNPPPDASELSIKKFFADLTGEPVHDVHLVQDNGALLSLYVKRGKVINKLWKLAAAVHLLKEDRKAKPGDKRAIKDDKVAQKRLDRAVKAYDKSYAIFLDLNEQRAKKNPGTKTLGAFVTFETQQGFLKAMDLYPQSFWARRQQPPELKMSKKPLKVRQAPPPTTILWENTHYKWRSRLCRRFCTGLGTFIALGITIVVCFFTQRERNNLQNSLVQSLNCELIQEIQAGIFNNSLPHAQFYANLTNLAELLQLIDEGDPAATAIARNDPTLRDCFCSSLNYGEAASAILDFTALCHGFYLEKSPLYALTFVATGVISVVNIGIQYLIADFSTFEKHHSLVNMELSISKRIFYVLFINTGLILLSVNAAFPKAIWIGSGNYADFSPDWYSSVGTSLIITMILNIISPQLFPLLSYWAFESTKKYKLAYSQRELNEMYLGPVFFLSYRTAQLLMTVFVTLLYSAGIPSLYPIACVAFAVQFYADKFFLFNFYRSPPSYSDRLSAWMNDYMPYAIIGHLAFAVWMFSAKGIFWDGITYQPSDVAIFLGLTADIDDGSFDFTKRLSQIHIVPLYIALLFVVLMKVLSFCFSGIDKIRSLCCATVTCGIFDDGTIKRRYLNPDYTDAVDNGELRGLVNYNILENPTYARALGVDAKFAKEHRHVASVHEASAVDLPVLPKSFKVNPLEVVEEQQRERSNSSAARPGIDSLRNEDDSQSTHRSLVNSGRFDDDTTNRLRAGSVQRGGALANAFRTEDDRVRSGSLARPERTSIASRPERTSITSNKGPNRGSIANAMNINPDEFD